MKGEEAPKKECRTEYATELKRMLTKAIECCRESLETSHKTPKHYYDRWARGNSHKERDLVMWKDKKTRNGRCMKLNKPWTDPWAVIKQLGGVVYRIKYVGKNKVGLKRRIVHYNQLKKFLEPSHRRQRRPTRRQHLNIPQQTMVICKNMLRIL